ncbi:PIN domain-containing protein [Chitinophaga sp. sic0106]|uniref:PIN domain-containing protein n=1 Tax=Chitinophaga sp. sic0106 TaxID=2854785 RepID=UPI001C48C744|nr:PIN domain-containing protein [Chitinophaga sp. sic0106]MBV7532612.1 PIN domain-containing protein [Chitinophaga sp. sic0106]
MISRKRLVVLLDANVLYPAPVRDLLLCLCEVGIIIPKWTKQIQHEWTESLLRNRPDLKRNLLARICSEMDKAFPDANTKQFEDLIPGIALPDVDDRHVLAAAIKCEADLIITFNKKDFPVKITHCFHIGVFTPDELVVELLRISYSSVWEALRAQVNALKNPPMSMNEVLDKLEKCGLKKAVAILRAYLLHVT